MLYRIYEKWLKRSISSSPVPRCVAVVIPSGLGGEWQKIHQLIDWCTSIGVKSILLSAIEDDPSSEVRLLTELKETSVKATVYVDQNEIETGMGGALELSISLNYSGKREVTMAIRELLKDVESGRLDPENIDEGKIESKLSFKQCPDLMIRLGGRQLSDFMIWQSSYSELYFTGTNWKNLRKIDFLRAIRSYQQRERRFGK